MLAGGGGVVDNSVVDVRVELLVIDDELVVVGDDDGDLVDVGEAVFGEAVVGEAVVGDEDLVLSSSSFSSSSSRRRKFERRPRLLTINGVASSARRLPAPVAS